jgi:hypothetical protein
VEILNQVSVKRHYNVVIVLNSAALPRRAVIREAIMKPIHRLAVLVVLIALVALWPPLDAQAQNTGCFGLSAADCKIVATADSNLAQETSFKFAVDLTLKFKGQGQSGNAAYNADGVFEVDPAAMQPGDPASVNALKMTLNFEGTEKSPATLAGGNVTTTLNAIIVDGNMYFRTGEAEQWRGFNLLDAITRAQETSASSMDAATRQMMQKLMTDVQFQKAIASIPNIKGFISLRKTGAAQVLEGQKQIEFVNTYNIQKLITAKELLPAIKAVMRVSGSPTKLTDAQLSQTAQVVARALTGSTLKVTRWVGAKDNMYHAFGIDLALRFNGATLGTASSSFTLDFHFMVKLTEVGKPVDVAGPEGAEMIDASDIGSQ